LTALYLSILLFGANQSATRTLLAESGHQARAAQPRAQKMGAARGPDRHLTARVDLFQCAAGEAERNKQRVLIDATEKKQFEPDVAYFSVLTGDSESHL
jgi:hypothetical protein